MDDLEASANKKSTSEETSDLLWCRIGRDIEIFRFESEQKVTYCTADNIGIISGILQNTYNPYSAIGNQSRINSMLLRA